MSREIVYSRNGGVSLVIETKVLDPSSKKRPLRGLEAQLGGIVDMDCADLPVINENQGTFFGSPAPGSLVVAVYEDGEIGIECKSVVGMEVVDTAAAYKEWKTKIQNYISRNSSDILPIENAWVCSSSSRWYANAPGIVSWFLPKVRGINKTGFVKTKPLESPSQRLMSLTQYLLADMNNLRSSAATVANAALTWSDAQWDRAEKRFVHYSGIKDMLERICKNNYGEVPMKVCPGSIGIIYDTDSKMVSPVLMPLLPPPVHLFDLSQATVDQWVQSTMRDIWIELVLDIQNIPGITEYKPSTNMVEVLRLFSLGLVTGGLAGAWKTGVVGYGMGIVGPLLTQAKDYAVATIGNLTAAGLAAQDVVQ